MQMTAPKASKPRKAPKEGVRVTTFRLTDEHRQALEEYALRVGLLQAPVRRVSKNDALIHLIKHSDFILKGLGRKRQRHSDSPPPGE